LDFEELTRGLLFIPSAQALAGLTSAPTGLTGAAPCRVLAWVNVLVCSLVSRLAAISGLVLFGA
jgi:hypothetical protein